MSVDDMDTGLRVNSVNTELALIRQRLDTVISHHDKELADHDVLHTAASSRLTVAELQLNTHEIKIADLQAKSTGAFNRFWVITSGCVGIIALLISVSVVISQ